MAWLTKTDVATIEAFGWTDAGDLEEGVLVAYLDAAKEACLAYAPPLAAGKDVPASWRIAQAMQARNLFNSGAAAPADPGEGGTYGVTARPLDWQIKQLLRPRRGIGVIR